MTDFHTLLFKAQLEALITEREAMKAANFEREQNGFTIGYAEDAFQALRSEFVALEGRIREAP